VALSTEKWQKSEDPGRSRRNSVQEYVAIRELLAVEIGMVRTQTNSKIVL
jgi:hypothetical protein